MLDTLQKYFHWPGITQDVELALEGCVGCLHKRKANLHKGEHYSKELPPHKCHRVYEDLIWPVSIKSKKKYLLTVMDGFTRYADAIPFENKSAKTVNEDCPMG